MNSDDDDMSIYAHAESTVRKLIDAGVSPEMAMKEIIERVGDVLYGQGERIASELLAKSRNLLTAERANFESFDRHLREHWGDAFDLLYLFGYGTAECADVFLDLHGPERGEDSVFVALVSLDPVAFTSRCCRRVS